MGLSGGVKSQRPACGTIISPSLPSFPLIQEFEVIAQIKLLQSACNNYSIAPKEHFGAWFRAMDRLSEAER